MTKTTKILLAISLAGFAVGFTNILWGVGTPVGAVFLGLFMIFTILEKETALFDEENRSRIAWAERNTASVARSAPAGQPEAYGSPPLDAAAHSA